jgi:hypothetical protein
LLLFADPSETQQAAIQLGQSIYEMGRPVNIAFGGNWLVNSPHAPYVASKMGGRLFDYSTG